MHGLVIAITCEDINSLKQNMHAIKDCWINHIIHKLSDNDSKFITENGFTSINCNATNETDFLFCAEPLLLQMNLPSCKGDYLEKLRGSIHGMYKNQAKKDLSSSQNELGYICIKLTDDISESIVAMKMILTSDGFTLTKDIKTGIGIWQKK